MDMADRAVGSLGCDRGCCGPRPRPDSRSNSGWRGGQDCGFFKNIRVGGPHAVAAVAVIVVCHGS